MSKNILVLTGSPRKQGNSDRMAEAFIKGAEQSGHTISKFEAGRKNIHGCRACEACWSKDTACVFRDGFTELEPMAEQAEVIVFCSPLYTYGFSAQLKAALDKFNAYCQPQCKRPLRIKECVLLTCGGDESADIFDGMIASYKSLAKYFRWENRGIIAVPAIHKKGDILKTDVLKHAEELGRNI
jgi:multimeric flavodoxin WrbA